MEKLLFSLHSEGAGQTMLFGYRRCGIRKGIEIQDLNKRNGVNLHDLNAKNDIQFVALVQSMVSIFALRFWYENK